MQSLVEALVRRLANGGATVKGDVTTAEPLASSLEGMQRAGWNSFDECALYPPDTALLHFASLFACLPALLCCEITSMPQPPAACSAAIRVRSVWTHVNVGWAGLALPML